MLGFHSCKFANAGLEPWQLRPASSQTQDAKLWSGSDPNLQASKDSSIKLFQRYFYFLISFFKQFASTIAGNKKMLISR